MNEVFGKKLGQYLLLEQLGEGGMAKVYNALDTRAEGNVAIKVILPNKRTSSAFLQQFEREAKALANLTHTNIVKVLNYGVQDGQPYLVMEYVPGGTLKEAMNHKMPWQTAAAILAPIARALDYVHRQQIVHRDVKPSNILLHEDFRPMLSDFGILKLLEGKEEKVESAIGAGIGTPEYMPPEQGMGKEVDFRADIYSLGLVFYEMITGQKPFTADSPMAIVIKHVTDELPLPTHIDKSIPQYVERAILRAVQKNPKNRYLSMGHFADALELIALGDKAPPQKINRISREKEKRQRSISIYSLSILLLVLMLGTSLFVYNYFTETQQPSVPSTANTAPMAATSTPNPPPTSTARSLPTETPVTTPITVSSASISLLGTPIVIDQSSPPHEIARWGIGGVNIVKWSPDGKTIALGTTSGIFLYNARTKELTLFIDTQFNVLTMSFNLAGDQITAGSRDGIVNAWDSTSGALVQSYNYTRPQSETITNDTAVTAISYSVDGNFLAIGYQNGAINYFPTNEEESNLELENYPTVKDLAISRDDRFIYASNGSKDIFVWDNQNQEVTSLSNLTPINRLILSNNQQWLLAGSDVSSVYLWNISESEPEPEHVSSFTNLGGAVTGFDFSHDDKYVAIGLSTGEIKIFAMPASKDEYSKTHVPLQSIKGYDEKILSIDSSPDQLIVASGNQKEGLKLWDIQTGEMVLSLNESRRAVEEINLSGDGLWLVTEHEDGLLRLWNVNAAQEAFPPFAGQLPKGVPFSPDNRFLAFIYSPGTNRADLIRIMELKTGKIVAELPGYIQKSFVQFTDDSKLMVMGNTYSASIWDVATWEQVDTHGGPTAGCGQYFTPQNELLAVIFNAGIMFTDEDDKKMEEMCGTKPRGAILMYYFYESHKMVFVLGNEKGDLWIWDFRSTDLGLIGSDTPYHSSNKIFLAGDQASGWYAYVDGGKILMKNISGSTGVTIDKQDDYQYRVALLPGKKLMALGSRYGSIHVWTMP
jgi:serine/threonine protein kinase